MDPKKGPLAKKLKDETELLSEAPLDNVRVHYNSSQPAELDADAFDEGSVEAVQGPAGPEE